MNRADDKLRRALHQLVGGPTQDEMDVDEILGLMLQISFALMMIFMIAFFLFRAKTGTELEQVQNLKQQELVSQQRQKLLLALERSESYWRAHLGLTAFAAADADGKISYKLNPNNQEAFDAGAKHADAKFSQRPAFLQEWARQTTAFAGEQSLTAENQSWLEQEVERRATALRLDCENLQLQAATALQSSFVQKPDTVRDANVAQLLQRYATADDTEKTLLVPELARRLRQRAVEALEKQCGAKLLLTY